MTLQSHELALKETYYGTRTPIGYLYPYDNGRNKKRLDRCDGRYLERKRGEGRKWCGEIARWRITGWREGSGTGTVREKEYLLCNFHAGMLAGGMGVHGVSLIPLDKVQPWAIKEYREKEKE